MTTPTLSRRQADNALAALALIEAKERGNLYDARAITNTAEPADLIEGLMLLVGAARRGHAVAAGVPVDEVDEMLRAMYLCASGGVV